MGLQALMSVICFIGIPSKKECILGSSYDAYRASKTRGISSCMSCHLQNAQDCHERDRKFVLIIP